MIARRGFLKLILNVMLAMMLVVPMLEVAEASASSRISSGISRLKARLLATTLLPRTSVNAVGEHSATQKLIAGAGMMVLVCTTSLGIVSCGSKNKMIHNSEPLITQFSNAEVETGDYVHVRIDGESYSAMILGESSDGKLNVEIFAEGFEGEEGLQQSITADKIAGKLDEFHADNGKQVLLHSLELDKAEISIEDAKRYEMSGFRKADMVYWHGIITGNFTDGSMEVMISSKIYVNHPNGEHNQVVVSLKDPVFTVVDEDKLASPPYK